MPQARKWMRRRPPRGYRGVVRLETPLRQLFLALVRLFYPTIDVSGGARVPPQGPVIAVANHPNGLLDPVLLRLALRRPLAFLAKSTLFANPLGRAAMAAFDAIPIYRAHEADTSRNEITFDRCRALLAGGGWLALFPEGTSHSDPQLRPLKTGAARIALSVEAAGGFQVGLRVLPVGLLYLDKGTFRSRVVAVVGEPFTLGEYAAQYTADERGAVAAVTARIGRALADVVVEAEDPGVQRALMAVAAWTSPNAGRDPEAVSGRARRMAAGWRTLVAEDPEAAERLTEAFRRYERLVSTLGITDPLAWEGPTAPSPGRFVASLAPIVLLAPLALLGALFAWLPYRLVRPLSVKLAGAHTDLIGTFKLLLGLVILTATYAAWGVAGACVGGWPLGVGALVAGPLSGHIALRFGERVDRRRELLRSLWLRATRARVAEAVAERRAALIAEVDAALARVEQGPTSKGEEKVGAAV